MRPVTIFAFVALTVGLTGCQTAQAPTQIPSLPAGEPGVQQWVVGVDGVGCPFCAYGLEKKLTGLPGVNSFQFNFERGEIDVGLAAGAVVTPAALANAVDEAGFGLRSLVVVGTGTVSTVDGARALDLGRLSFPLLDHGGPDGVTTVRGTVTKVGDGWCVRLAKDPS